LFFKKKKEGLKSLFWLFFAGGLIWNDK